MIDRRAFLYRLGFGTISAAAAASTFDIEKLLWVPKPIITIPAMPITPGFQFDFTTGLKPKGVWSGTLLTDGKIKALTKYATDLTDTKYQASIYRYMRMIDGR